MNNKYLFFSDFYKDFATYGIERTQNVLYKDKYLVSFSEKDFYDKLYVPVYLEEFGYEKIDSVTDGRLITICGPSGSGKSTVSKKILFTLNCNPRYKIIAVDIRIENSSKEFDDNETEISDSYVREMILNHFEAEFELLSDKENTKSVDLYAFLLSPESSIKKYRRSQVFRKINKLSKKIYLNYAKYKNNTTSEKKLAFLDWFKENFTHQIDIIQELEELIDIPHYIAYNKYKDEYDKLIIWLDNIDAFSNIQQSQIISILHNIQKSVLNSSQLVVSVREENIYVTENGNHKDNLNEPYISKVSFEDTLINKKFRTYDSINVPVMDFKQLDELVNKKLKFCYNKHNSLESKFNSKLFSHNEYTKTLQENNIAKFNIERESLIIARKSLEKKVEKYKKYKLKYTSYIELDKLSKNIVGIFNQEKVIFIANNSIQEYLRIHSAFFYYIIEVYSVEMKSETFGSIPKSDLITLFYSWIYTVDESFGIEAFNVIEEIGNININKNEMQVGCFLPYLILTRIWNKSIKLNGKSSPMNNPIVSDIIDELTLDFDFTKKEVLDSLLQLHLYAGGKGNFIAFRAKNKVELSKDIDINSRVRVTYRGKVTLGHTINSFGYLNECTQRVRAEDDNPDDALLIFEKLSIICSTHLESLKLIKKNSNKKNWYKQYLLKYGIPLDPSFVRDNKDIGEFIPNTRFKRALYLETVFDGLGRYFQIKNESREQLNKLSGEFRKELNEVIKN